MSQFLNLLHFFSKSWRGFLFSALIASLTILSSVALLGVSSFLIAMAALQPSIAEIQVAIVGVRFFGISRGVFRYLERYISHTVTFRLLARLRVWFYQSLEPKAPAALGQFHSGDLLNRIVSDIETLQDFFIRVISPSLVMMIVYFSVSAWFIGFDPAIILVLTVLFLLGGIILPLAIQYLSIKPVERLSTANSALMVSGIDALQGAQEIRVYGLMAEKKSGFSQINEEAIAAQKHTSLIEAVQDGLFSVINGLGWLAILFIGVKGVESGVIEGVMLASLVMAGMASFEAIQPMPLAGHHLREGLLAWNRLSDLLDFNGKGSIEKASVQDWDKIQFNKVSLQYLADEPDRLINVDLVIDTGEKVAIVGANGSGKSSLINLLLKFWEPASGSILVDDNDLLELDGYLWREGINTIGQSTYLFNATIRENILIADPNASEEKLAEAIGKARLTEFIASLPQGLETHTGEMGGMISGGERQRIAIARALLKDSPLLILDEPLVNLDSVTKNEVWGQLRELMADKTCILITHDMAQILEFDRIVFMVDGKVAGQGSYRELLGSSPAFSDFIQAGGSILALD